MLYLDMGHIFPRCESSQRQNLLICTTAKPCPTSTTASGICLRLLEMNPMLTDLSLPIRLASSMSCFSRNSLSLVLSLYLVLSLPQGFPHHCLVGLVEDQSVRYTAPF